MAQKGNIWCNSAHVTVGLKTPTKENIAMKMIYPPLQLQLLQNSKKFSVLLPLAFALRVFGMVVLPAILCSCLGDGDPEYTKISVGWAPGYAYVPTCKTLVKYQATGIEIQGVSIPVPQLGGAAQIGGVKVDPTLLNRAYHTTQTLDTSYHNSCALLPSFTTEKAKFENAVQDMQDSQTKLQQLAM